MKVTALRQAPLLPKPGSSVIIPVLARNCSTTIPTSPSLPTTSGMASEPPS